jgi:hypothetical protein
MAAITDFRIGVGLGSSRYHMERRVSCFPEQDGPGADACRDQAVRCDFWRWTNFDRDPGTVERAANNRRPDRRGPENSANRLLVPAAHEF